MRGRLVAWALAAAAVLCGCSGIAGEVRPGDSMAKLCDSARFLASATGLAQATLDARDAGQGPAAADFAAKADIARQDAMAAAGHSKDLEGHLDPPGSPGFADRVHEIDDAQHAVDLVVGALAEPAAPVTVEARPRLLAAAEMAVGAIGLPEDCTAIEVPTPAP
jgi:hypothetical protein